MVAVVLLLAAPRGETIAAWERAVGLTESRISRELASSAGFLATDFLPRAEREAVSRAFEAGEVFTAKLPVAVEVPGGMAHHWLGAVFVPDVDVEELVRWLQEYDDHGERFEEVEDSRLLSREGDKFEIFLRLRRKKIVTVRYATERGRLPESWFRTLLERQPGDAHRGARGRRHRGRKRETAWKRSRVSLEAPFLLEVPTSPGRCGGRVRVAEPQPRHSRGGAVARRALSGFSAAGVSGVDPAPDSETLVTPRWRLIGSNFVSL